MHLRSARAKFSFLPVMYNFVFKELSKLNTPKTTGLDGIPAGILKDGASVLTAPMNHMINLSLSSETVPDTWKSPIYKKQTRTDAGNYRPGSILNVA